MTYSYFPGCTLKNKAKDLITMPEGCAKFLDLNWKKLKTGSAAELCIHRHPMKSPQNLSSVRALADAKEKDRISITVCSACHHVIKRVKR